jgi:hypothetical protein
VSPVRRKLPLSLIDGVVITHPLGFFTSELAGGTDVGEIVARKRGVPLAPACAPQQLHRDELAEHEFALKVEGPALGDLAQDGRDDPVYLLERPLNVIDPCAVGSLTHVEVLKHACLSDRDFAYCRVADDMHADDSVACERS